MVEKHSQTLSVEYEQSSSKGDDGYAVLSFFSISLLVISLLIIGYGVLTSPSYKQVVNPHKKIEVTILAQNGVDTFFKPALQEMSEPISPAINRPILEQQAAAIATMASTSTDPSPSTTRRGQSPNDINLSKPVIKVIDLNADWVAPDIHYSFASALDFNGGKTSILAPASYTSKFTPLTDIRTELAQENELTLTLARGETLSKLLERANIRRQDHGKFANALNKEWSLRKLRAGQKFTLTLSKPELTIYQEASLVNARLKSLPYALLRLEMRPEDNKIIRIISNNSTITSMTVTPQTTLRYASVKGTITDSLFASAARAGSPQPITANLANLFLYDVDFQRQIHRGDTFEAIYEVYYDRQGKAVAYGDVIFGQLSWQGGRKSKGYYRFTDNGKKSWFDESGQSAQRLLMKTPIEGARITSSFGRRRHPVLGYTKAHKGVDFGARRGTPIMAAGNGTIVRANRFGSFGNYIRIKHANGYETAYAHLKGFGKGIKKGRSVSQGQIIGYVGTTGRSTGPHLHYEVLKRGKQINPMTIKVATGKKLSGAPLDRFTTERDWINSLKIVQQPVILAQK